MMTGFVSKLALTTVAAVGLYVATVGLSVTPGSCLPTVGSAAAGPSPTCGSDERECLRLSAKTGLYGVRYVTPEDVARCVEAFNACIHGTLNGGNPVPPVSTSPGGSTRKALPAHLGIPYYADADIDCRLSGDAVNCKASRGPNLPLVSETLEITGTLSGLTMTGTYTSRVEMGGSGCNSVTDISGPATLVFTLDGTVVVRKGPSQAQSTYTPSSCGNPGSWTIQEEESSMPWSAIE
jgi:hypothetical protein